MTDHPNPSAAAGASAGRPRRPWRRRALAIVGFVAALLLGVVAVAPALLSTPAGNRWLAPKIARAFAPGRLEFAAVRLSWVSSTRLSDVTLSDPNGRAVVAAPSATLMPSLWGLITRPNRLGTLALENSSFTIERRPDGSIDLADALEGVFRNRKPSRDLTIRADGAQLRLTAPGLAAPLHPDRMDLLVELRPAPATDLWTINLAFAETSRTLKLSAEVDHWRSRPTSREGAEDIDVAVDSDFPASLVIGGALVDADLRGKLKASRLAGRWTLDGRAHVEGVLAAAAADPGGSIEPRAVVADCAFLPVADGVRVAGSLEVRYDVRSTIPGEKVRTSGQSIAVTADATYKPETDLLTISALDVQSPYGPLHAAGRIADLDGEARLDLRGALPIDWNAVSRAVADRVEPGARLAGGPLQFRVSGPIRGERKENREAFSAEASVALASADVYGMKLGATPIAARLRGGVLDVDPIETTLNGGKLSLHPAVDLAAEGGPVVRFGGDTYLEGAEVNAEVSSRVLSFVAPVLDRATGARGYISAKIDEATIPLSKDAGRKANIKGSVVFDDVEFVPGPLTREIVALVSNRDFGPLRLDEPVTLTIADGRINQKGLALPIGTLTRIEIDGWVDFDKNLGLVASLPMTPRMVGGNRVLGAIVDGARVRIPIGGTLSAPKIDREAFKAAFRDTGKELLNRSAAVGVFELLNGLAKPRAVDPDAPIPPTAEEKKAERLEKRNLRRRNRGLDPLPKPR